MTTPAHANVDTHKLAGHGGSGAGQPPPLQNTAPVATKTDVPQQDVQDPSSPMLNTPASVQQSPPSGEAQLGATGPAAEGSYEQQNALNEQMYLPPAMSMLPAGAFEAQTHFLSVPYGSVQQSLPRPVDSTGLAKATNVVERDVLAKMTGGPHGTLQHVATQSLRPRSVDSRPLSAMSMGSGRSGRSSRLSGRRSLPKAPSGPGHMGRKAQEYRSEDDDLNIVLSSTDGQRAAPMHSSPVDAVPRQAVDSLTTRLSTMTLAGRGDRTATPELSAVLDYTSVPSTG